MKSKVPNYIQGHRGFAVLTVVIYYFSLIGLLVSFWRVNIFFVTSGFVIYSVAFTPFSSLFLFSQFINFYYLHNYHLLLIGTISFSIYLWYQPTFVLANLSSDLVVFLGLLVLFVLNYNFVEKTFRKKANPKEEFLLL